MSHRISRLVFFTDVLDLIYGTCTMSCITCNAAETLLYQWYILRYQNVGTHTNTHVLTYTRTHVRNHTYTHIIR